MTSTEARLRPATRIRDGYVDLMRTIGLFCLIVAHTAAPVSYQIIRVFDVPLMVFVSSLCYSHKLGYYDYLKKRVLRIYKPVGIFLCLFFIVTIPVAPHIPKFDLTWYKVLGSLMLWDKPSIGYVWIMRVFILTALVMPPLYVLLKRCNPWQVCLLITGVYGGNQILVHFVMEMSPGVWRFILDEYVIYLIGYLPIVILGIRAKADSWQILGGYMVLLCVLAFADLMVQPEFSLNPMTDKYPPHGMYVIYGAVVSIGIWIAKPLFNGVRYHSIVAYTGRNSMWLYLWHIFPAYLIIPVSKIHHLWFGRYVFVLLSMYALTWVFFRITSKYPKLAWLSKA